MATIIIRGLEDATKKRLRVRASQHGRSMEEEAREILRMALSIRSEGNGNLAELIRRRFAAIGGVERTETPREAMREPPRFSR
jgi:antitoxin FitA